VGLYIYYHFYYQKSQQDYQGSKQEGMNYMLWREVDPDTAQWNVFLFDSKKQTKMKINQEPLQYVRVLNLNKEKAAWIDEREDDYIMHIYDIETQKEEKEFPVPFRVSDFHLSQDLQWVVFVKSIYSTGPYQLVLYNIDSGEQENISEAITEPLNSNFCFSGYEDRIVFEDRDNDQTNFYIYDLATRTKEDLSQSINYSVICPQIEKEKIMYATCDCNVPVLEGFQKSVISSSEVNGSLTFRVFDLTNDQDFEVRKVDMEEHGNYRGWWLLGDKIIYSWSYTPGLLDEARYKSIEIDVKTGEKREWDENGTNVTENR